MTRKALALAPTYGTVVDGHDAYVNGMVLRQLARQSGRYWAFHEVPTTVALPDNRFAKSLTPFTSHTTEEKFRELLAEYGDLGVKRPSGYADVFHERFQSPRVEWSVNALLAPCFTGGWQDALEIGFMRGVYRKYDMRSAYLWAATLGLPDTRTYTRSLSPARAKYDGLYRVKLLEPATNAPFPFNRATQCLATTEEIERYNLKISEVVAGVVWRRMIDTSKMLEAIKLTSTWKEAGRMYWGRWAQMQRVQCVSKKSEWRLPNCYLNIPWAHIIVSRVKARLWEASKDAVHVFVDSVITPHTLPEDSGLGGWKLEKVYDQGVLIRGVGQYGDPKQKRLDRMAGVVADSPLRNIQQ